MPTKIQRILGVVGLLRRSCKGKKVKNGEREAFESGFFLAFSPRVDRVRVWKLLN